MKKKEQSEFNEENAEEPENDIPRIPKPTQLDSQTPALTESDSEEDVFSQKMNEMASVPIKTLFKEQQQTEQLNMLQESDF